MNKMSPLYGLQSKKQLYKMLNITNGRQFSNNSYDRTKIYIQQSEQRLIEAPNDLTKCAQYRIKNLLSKCDFPDYVFSGIKGRSYFSNAEKHKNCRYLFKTDISAFFPSITRNKVYKFFLQDLKTSPDVAKILTDICTVDITPAVSNDPIVSEYVSRKKIKSYHHLCTGSPVSPLLSYFVNKSMFDAMKTIADNNGLVITIYMDDVFFSSKNEIPVGVRSQIIKTFTKNGYNLSIKKLRYYKPYHFKKVTGVYVSPDNQLKIPNTLRFRIVQGYSNGRMRVPRQELKGLITASDVIEKGSFAHIKF